MADIENTPAGSRVRLVQLGSAKSAVVNPGAPVAMALLAFVAAFGLSCVAVVAVGRIRRGWERVESTDRDDLGRESAAGAA
jgi:hypothetical protein